MKAKAKPLSILIIIVTILLFLISCKKQEEAMEANEDILYKDGTFEIQTEPDYEGYYVKATVVIEDGLITTADWCIYDSNRNDRPFDETYKEVYANHKLYAQQSIDDWNGSREYSSKLIEEQDLNEVDAVSGATWTNKKFKEAISEVLKKASNQ